jgi:hypothetical protein
MTGSITYDSDFQTSPHEESEKKIIKVEEKEEKEEKVTNILFGGMIVLTIGGTAIIIKKLNSSCQELIELDPNYKFPSIQDMYIVPVLVLFLVVINLFKK